MARNSSALELATADDAAAIAAGAGPFYAKCGFQEVARVTYRKTPLVYFELVL